MQRLLKNKMTFHSNLISIHGDTGRAWLDSLSQRVKEIAEKHDLSNLKEVSNLTYNYVLAGFQDAVPIVLKMSFDDEELQKEIRALKAFESYGAVKVIAFGEDFFMCERTIPGNSLKSFFPFQENESIAIACSVIKHLHKAPRPVTHSFSHIKDWLEILDKNWDIPSHYLQKARRLRGHLLQSSPKDILLHGDLHHDNVLRNNDSWCVIDPKGVIGDPAYECAAFIRNPIPELLTHENCKDIMEKRIVAFSKMLDYPKQRIRDWCFVQAVLAWVWNLEDNLDATVFMNLAERAYGMTSS